MSLLMPSCQQVSRRLTDFEEGALGPWQSLGLRLHLRLCAPCRAFHHTLDRASALVREAWDDAPSARAEAALDLALAALREGRVPMGPQLHPEPEAWAALAPDGDPFTALLLRTHLGHCAACRREQGAEAAIVPGVDPLEALRPYLPPEAQWRWHRRGLGGLELAVVRQDRRTGASLLLARLPGAGKTPMHGHTGRERTLILCGALQDGPAHLRPGDWISHDAGTQHHPTADRGGECWALITLEAPVRFQGWRSVFNRVG